MGSNHELCILDVVLKTDGPRPRLKNLSRSLVHFSRHLPSPPTSPGNIEVFNSMQIKELNLQGCMNLEGEWEWVDRTGRLCGSTGCGPRASYRLQQTIVHTYLCGIDNNIHLQLCTYRHPFVMRE